MKPKITDKDKGAKRIIKEIKRFDGSSVTIGVHEGAGTYERGQPVSLIAAVHEFGTAVVPDRSFLRSTYEDNKAKWIKAWNKLKDDVLKRKKNEKQALSQIGILIMTAIRNRLNNMEKYGAEPLKSKETSKTGRPSTYEFHQRMGAPTRPLILTGKLRDSITYEVHD